MKTNKKIKVNKRGTQLENRLYTFLFYTTDMLSFMYGSDPLIYISYAV